MINQAPNMFLVENSLLSTLLKTNRQDKKELPL